MSDERDTRETAPAAVASPAAQPPLRRRMTARARGGAGIDYANARVRARRAKLLRAGDYTTLLEQPNLESVLAELNHGKYAEDIERSMVALSGAPVVGRATGDFFTRELALVLKLYSPKEGRALMVLAAMWDIEDLKTVVRSAYAGQPAATTIASFRGGGVTIGHDELAMLAREQSVEAVVATASTLSLPYAAALRAGAKQYAASKTLSDFEAAIDREYAEWAAGELQAAKGGGLAGEYVQRMIDVRNIMTALRLLSSGGVGQSLSAAASASAASSHVQARAGRQENASAAAPTTSVREFIRTYFLPGGAALDVPHFRRMLNSGSVEESINALASTPYARTLRHVLGEYALSGSLAEFERVLTQLVLRETVRVGKRDLLGMGVPAAYLLSLQAEVANLRVIAHGKAFGIPNEMLSKELNLV